MCIAEYFEKAYSTEVINVGDVVSFIGDGKVSKVTTIQDSMNVAGVVVDNSPVILKGNEYMDNLPDNQKVLVALAGVVYVKVDCPVRTGNLVRVMENGSVEVTNVLDRFVIGKAIIDSLNGTVYIKVMN